jgi:hypothetical protein
MVHALIILFPIWLIEFNVHVDALGIALGAMLA